MNILVTGATGFIGFHVCYELSKNHNVIGVDNLNNYYSVLLKKKRLKILKNKIKFLKLDISNYKKINELFSKNKIDLVIHLAAQAGVRYSFENPWLYEKNNNLGMLNLLEACKKYKVKKIIYASSSSVYGERKGKLREDMDLNPISPYALTKKYNEELTQFYDFTCIGLRFFSVYGEFGRPDMAYYKFAKNIILGKEIFVYGDGKQKRDFTYIKDIVDGIKKAIDYNKSDIFNLGCSKPINVNELIKILEKHLDKKAIVKHVDVVKGDVSSTYACTKKSEKLLKFKSKYNVEYGLKKFCDWFLK